MVPDAGYNITDATAVARYLEIVGTTRDASGQQSNMTQRVAVRSYS
jgi:hypothetical protein